MGSPDTCRTQSRRSSSSKEGPKPEEQQPLAPSAGPKCREIRCSEPTLPSLSSNQELFYPQAGKAEFTVGDEWIRARREVPRGGCREGGCAQRRVWRSSGAAFPALVRCWGPRLSTVPGTPPRKYLWDERRCSLSQR